MYEFKNPPALRKLVGREVKLDAYTTKMLKAAQTAAFELYAEEAVKNSALRKMYELWKKFRAEVMLWHRFAEHTYSSFVFATPAK